MIGDVEEQDLRGTNQQRGLEPRCIRRQAAFQEAREQMTQRAEPAHHGCDDRPHQGAVALLERVELASFELFVERPLAAQHSVDQAGRDAASREAGNV